MTLLDLFILLICAFVFTFVVHTPLAVIGTIAALIVERLVVGDRFPSRAT